MTDLPPTEEHQPAPDEPLSHKRRWFGVSTPVAIVIVVAFIAWGLPILGGWHFGCNVLAGDKYRETRLGIQMCRPENTAEKEAKVKQAQEAERQAQTEKEATAKAEGEKTAQKEHEAEQQHEAERPGLEAAASKLKTEAASWRHKQRHEEGVKKHDEAEAERLSNDANRAEGEASDTLNTQSDNYSSDADTASANIDTDEGEVTSKESEAKTDEEKASEG